MPPVSATPASPVRTAVLLSIIVLGALAVRSAFSYDLVITPTRINLQDNDSWYHIRLIDHMTRHWPARPGVDPYALPNGQQIPVAPLFDTIVSTAALVIGLGEPTTRTIQIVAAWTPAVLGALIPLAVFLATRRLFDTTAALMAAALVAVMPGHLLERSRLGYVDHHVLEALLATTCFWLTVRAIQQKTRRDRAIAAVIAGVTLALYLLAWASGSYLIAILTTWLVVQNAVDAVRRDSSTAINEVAFIMGVTALPVVWLLQLRLEQFVFQMISLAGLAAAAVVLESIRIGLARVQLAPLWQPAGLAAAAVAGWIIGASVNPVLAEGFVRQIGRLRPDPTAFSVIEAMPLTAYASMPWINVNPFMVLGTGLPLSALGFILVGAASIKRPRADWTLLVVWTTFALVSTLLRNRFGYYLVPMLAIMGGWVCAWFLSLVRAQGLARDVIAAAIGALAFAPNLWPARAQLKADAGISGAWVGALDWMREHTPPPFPDPKFFDSRYDPGAPIRPHYSVMAWWDYGYWIMYGAQRVPNANPTQAGAPFAGEFLSETDPSRAASMLAQTNARYIVLDDQLPLRIVAPPVYVMGKFETILQWSRKAPRDYYEPVYVKGDRGELLPAIVFYPEYYQTMVNRLFMFQGKAIFPSSASVMSYADKLAPNGVRYREVTSMRTFSNYPEAQAYLASLGPGPHRLVGLYPDQTPIPLEALPDYRISWSSPDLGFFNNRPRITIFEHRAPASGNSAVH